MKIFERQIWHLLVLLLLLAGTIVLLQYDDTLLSGSLWGVGTNIWLIMALAIPIAHHLYVWLCWRLELHYKLLTRMIGPNAFNIYVVGFFILFLGRILFLILLSIANKNTFDLNSFFKFFITGIITAIVVYASYSVKKYFGMTRAAGSDHFYPDAAKRPFVKKGIFKYTNNGMYTYAFLVMYVPGLLWQSKTALLAAVFSHIFIWAHYYFTELPDMKRIYKTTPGKRN